MSQLKPSFTREIRDALENSKFTLSDFEIEYPETGRNLLRIIFIHKPNYSLLLSEEYRQLECVYFIKMIPGEFKIQESSQTSLGGVVDEIPKWCENIRRDLYALAPKIDLLEQLRQQLHRNLDELVSDPNDYFGPNELDLVDERFNRLYADIANLKEDHALTKQQLATLKKEIEEFKQSARAYPKGIWARITSNKLVKTAGGIVNSTEGRTFIFQQIRRALGLSDES